MYNFLLNFLTFLSNQLNQKDLSSLLYNMYICAVKPKN